MAGGRLHDSLMIDRLATAAHPDLVDQAIFEFAAGLA
jgi:hypothetical protein